VIGKVDSNFRQTDRVTPHFRARLVCIQCLEEVGKQPYYFTRRDGQVITIAGLWDEWTDKESGKTIKSCSMLITSSNKFVADVHDRMPVILESKDFEQWERGDLKDAEALMKPASKKVLQMWSVSKRVNSSRTSDEDASLLAPLVAELNN
jgi:putative SOS response-associated peptidase YedK